MMTFIDKGQKRTMVLLCGWAFDHRIFESLNMPYNRIVTDRHGDEDVSQALCRTMEQHDLARVSLLGWSQGAFEACTFAQRYPDRVDELILVGVRKQYDTEGLAQVQRYLRANTRAYLYQFYKTCFAGQQQDYRRFREQFLDDYLAAADTETLVTDLHRLGQAEIRPDALRNIDRVTLVHGRHDAIAPPDAAAALAQDIPSCRWMLLDAGHLPFLHEDFAQVLHGS